MGAGNEDGDCGRSHGGRSSRHGLLGAKPMCVWPAATLSIAVSSVPQVQHDDNENADDEGGYGVVGNVVAVHGGFPG